MLDGDATLAAIEDDVRSDLANVGFTVTKSSLPREQYNAAMVAGEFHLAFSETWGPPYDPHSYASSWSAPNEAYYAALAGLPEPNTQAVIAAKVANITVQTTETARQTGWTEILNILHSSATELPFDGKRIPAVFNSRLSGYENGLQQFDYPIHTLRVLSGSNNITVAPGAQSGLFTSVGRLDPHSYRPNEFFANNWVYDGLVEYGPGGTILPALATSWTVEDLTSGGQKYTFTLRSGVTFHDGAAWNCKVAKMNFDNVLAPPLTTGDWHGWYGLPGQINSINCPNGDNGEFVLTTKEKYYPLLQELSYIRPLRMLSPNMFNGGLSNNYLTQNTCPAGWGDVTNDGITVKCTGTLGISGTGRFKYVETTIDSNNNTVSVLFERNPNHWDVRSGSDVVEFVKLVVYADASAVYNALIDKTLDAVVGDGVLTPANLETIRTTKTTEFSVSLTEPLQNRIIIFNTAKAPTNDLQTRKVLIHAVNKAAIITKELGVLGQSVDALFPKTAPYCNVALTPRWDYDLEKAQLLNCPSSSDDTSDFSSTSVAVIVILAVVGVVAFGTAALAGIVTVIGVIIFVKKREQAGTPLFKPLLKANNEKVMAEIKPSPDDAAEKDNGIELEKVTARA